VIPPEPPREAAEELSLGPMQDFWSESGTTPDRVDDALRKLLRERHADDEGLAPARVLNLVVIVDRDWKGEVSNRLAKVGRFHASRTVLCAVEDGRTKLDAWAAISADEPREGISVMHEQVEIDLGPQHLPRLNTIIDPVIVSELPTVLWSPHGHEEGVESVRQMVDVMLLDSDDGSEPGEALERAWDLLESAYVVDLAWLRTTPWRERLASSFDPPSRQAALRELGGITIRHRASSRSSALLLAGWLTSRLGWKAHRLESDGGQRLQGAAGAEHGDVKVVLQDADQDVPGLAGVTVSAEGFTLSLDRQRGGLRACEQRDGEQERVWNVLGASRGEGGILGEGVRQAHLRDPTYGPALQAARALCAA